MSKILVFAEQRDGELKKVAFENLSLAKKLSSDLGAEVVAVLIGSNISGLGESLGKYGAAKVIACQNDTLNLYQPEGYAKILAETVTSEDASIVIMGSTLMGNDLAHGYRPGSGASRPRSATGTLLPKTKQLRLG